MIYRGSFNFFKLTLVIYPSNKTNMCNFNAFLLFYFIFVIVPLTVMCILEAITSLPFSYKRLIINFFYLFRIVRANNCKNCKSKLKLCPGRSFLFAWSWSYMYMNRWNITFLLFQGLSFSIAQKNELKIFYIRAIKMQ